MVAVPVMPMVVVPTMMMPADLLGLDTINLVLPNDRRLRAIGARRYQVPFC
jgi:hypothetical protein